MSSLTPSRIRNRTSDITDFFRSSQSVHSRSPANDVSTQSQVSTYTLNVPSTSMSHEGLSKKKSTRIPFLGRQRKKSNPNTSSERESTDVGEQSSRTASTETRHTPVIDVADHSSSDAPSPSFSSKTQSTSLGSKLVAHFQPRVRKLSALGLRTPVPSTSSSKDSLSPPTVDGSRGASLDSGSTETRSTTPRPPQPTITVSRNSENLDEYKDLFTMPKKKRSDYITPSESIALGSGSEAAASDAPRRGSAPTILDASRQKVARTQRAESPLIKSSMKSPRKASPTEKRDSPPISTSRSSDSTRSSQSSEKLIGPSIQRRQSTTPSTPAADYSAQQRVRMRQQAAATEKRTRPPSMPLPQTPPSPSIPKATPSPNVGPSSTPLTRPRAGTAGSIASVIASPLSQSTLPDDPQGDETPKAEAFSLDLDSATREELREALVNRNRQYDELTSHLQRRTDKHAAEKAALEKKVSQLEREISKKDNQIKGLMWLVANNKNPPATDFPPNLALPALPTTTAEAEREARKVTLSTRLPTRRNQLSDDSGAESHFTSGAESLRTSETSGNESPSFRHRKLRRPYALGEAHGYRSSKQMPPPGLVPEGALPEVPPYGARSSVSLVSLSASSSTSSLLPPSPSMTVSSLTSIPESPSSLRYSSKPDSHEHQSAEERRGIRAANRISTSSMASSSTAASSAYAVNLKRSRPPSIAQVLEHSPDLGQVLDKLRPSNS